MNAGTPRLTLYSRPGCHLCDEMKAVIEDVRGRVPLVLEVIDISADPDLIAVYGLEIPVLLIEDKKAAKYRVTAQELERQLNVRSER